MRLDRFILNTDYDTLKEVSLLVGSVNIPPTTLQNRGDMQSAHTDIDVSSGAYLEMESAEMSVVNGSFCSASGSYDSSSEVSYRYNIKRRSSTKYRIEANVMNLASDFGPRTTQDFTVNIKLHLFVPSTQED